MAPIIIWAGHSPSDPRAWPHTVLDNLDSFLGPSDRATLQTVSLFWCPLSLERFAVSGSAKLYSTRVLDFGFWRFASQTLSLRSRFFQQVHGLVLAQAEEAAAAARQQALLALPVEELGGFLDPATPERQGLSVLPEPQLSNFNCLKYVQGQQPGQRRIVKILTEPCTAEIEPGRPAPQITPPPPTPPPGARPQMRRWTLEDEN